MPQSQRLLSIPLLRHLTLAISLKLVALVALWWFFVHGHRVDSDPAQTAIHLLQPFSAVAAQATAAGASR
jgi:hypothetical protein